MGRILLSICAVVVAAGLGASAQKGLDHQQPAEKGQPASDQGTQIASIGTPVSERQREASQGQGEARAQRDDVAERDLQAQQTMAFIAAIQLILTGVGIWYIRKTLLETEAAVKSANAATAAAAEANTILREADRPWILNTGYDSGEFNGGLTKEGVFKPIANGFGISIRLNNSGRRPATRAIVQNDFKLVAPGSGPPTFVPLPFDETKQATIGPGIGISTMVVLDDAETTAFREGRELWVYCRVDYSDASGLSRFLTEACVQVAFQGQRARPGQPLEPHYGVMPKGPQNILT